MAPTELTRALVDIRALRRHVAASTEFRGYGPLTLAATATLAVAAGVVQWQWVPDPAAHPTEYAMLWLSLAVLCAALIATQMLERARRLHSGLADEMISLAVLQFLPAGVAGAAVPWVLLRSSTELVWVLPGVWQIIFSLGVFASCRSLPRGMLAVNTWFLLTGLLTLGAGPRYALSPFSMAGAFGGGMTLVTLIQLRSARKKAGTDAD